MIKEPAFERLDQSGRALYRTLLAEAERCSTETVFRQTSYEAVCRAFHALLSDRPEYFWLTGSSKATLSTRGAEKTLYFRPETCAGFSSARIPAMRRALEARVKELAQGAARAAGDAYGRALYIHDALVNQTDYVETAHCHDAYGCLVERRAVCSGYAAAYQLLMGVLGVECGRVQGASASRRGTDDSHEWNYICLPDGCRYYVDVTWDDPAVQEAAPGSNLSHDFFCLDDAELALTHRIGAESIRPGCRGQKYNYYVYTGRFVSRYSFESVRAVARAQMRADPTGFSVKFGSRAEAAAARRELFDDKRVFQIEGFRSRVTVSTSKSGLILHFKTG